MPGNKVGQKFIPYEDAKQYVQRHDIASRKQFWRWHKSNKIQFIPKMPHRVYPEWVSWNEFLGNTNTFHPFEAKNFRPYWEAVRWAQVFAKQHDVSTRYQWLAACDEYGIPDDIPKHPDMYYKEFVGRGWGVWLGTTIHNKVKAQEEDIGVMALCRVRGEQQNVFQVVVANDGIVQMQDILSQHNYLTPFVVYKFERELANRVKGILQTHASHQDHDQYITPNIHALLFELDSVLIRLH